MELPCIVSDINGSNEIIKNKLNGIIISKKNTHALLDAMIVIKNNNVLRNYLIKNSRSSVLEKFNKDMFYNTLLSEYKSLENNL